jgi:AraC-like DNA-binding protein
MRVIDVAVDAGFADVTSFHRAFRREYGCTPAQVRAAAKRSPSTLSCWETAERVE